MRNLTASFFYFAARVFAAILQLRLVTKFFGGQYAGLSALLNQLSFYVAMIELGLAASAISLLYAPIKAGDHEQTSGLLFALQKDTRKLMVGAAPVIAMLVLGYARHVHSTLPASIVLATFTLTAVSGFVSLLAIHYQAYLNASEQMFKVHLVLGCGHLTKTAVGVAIAAVTGHYLWLPATIATVSAAEVLAMRSGFHRSFRAYTPRAVREAFTLLRSRAKYVLFHRIGGLVYYQSDFIILSLTATLITVKQYAEVQYLIAGILGLFSAVFSALCASIARRQLNVSSEVRWRQYRAVAQATYVLSCAVSLAFFFAAPDVLQLLFHEEPASMRTMILFGCLLLLNLIRTVDDTYVTATGAFDVGFYLPVLEGPIYIGLGIMLSRRIGMDGVIWAGIVTNLIFAVVAKTAVVAYGVLFQPLWRFIRLRLWNAVVAAVAAAPLLAVNLWAARFSGHAAMHLALIAFAAIIYGGGVALLLVRHGFAEHAAAMTNGSISREAA